MAFLVVMCTVNTFKNIIRGNDMKYYECYHSVWQYSSDGCNGCKYEMDCYNHFLSYMLKEDKNDK